MGGGAWPFLVGGVICLVDSVNERDLCCKIGEKSYCVKAWRHLVGYEQSPCQNGVMLHAIFSSLLYETIKENLMEVGGKNRSVMPFDVLGCTRATMTNSTSILACEKSLANL